MKPILIALALAAAGAEAATSQATAPRLGGFYLSASSGGAAHSDLQRAHVRTVWAGQPRDFFRRLAPSTSPTLGLAAGYWVTPWWGVRAQAGLLPTRFEVTVSNREKADLPADSMLVGGRDYAGLWIWAYDVNVLLRAPITPRNRVMPYGLLGAGAVRYQRRGEGPVPPEAERAFAGATPVEFAGVLGAGVIVPLQRRGFLLTFELSDHLVRTPVRRVREGELAPPDASFATGPQVVAEAGEDRVRLTSHVQLRIGFSWSAR